VFLILLLVANAFFAAAEFALVSVRDTRIQQLIEARRIGARTVQRLHQNSRGRQRRPLGITLTSLTSAGSASHARSHPGAIPAGAACAHHSIPSPSR